MVSRSMGSFRIISILTLAIFSLTLSLEIVFSTDRGGACASYENVPGTPQIGVRDGDHLAKIEFPSEKKEIPCSDPCQEGFCHLGHCSHLTIASVPQIKIPSTLQIYGLKSERHIPVQHPSFILRPPII
jgi:hypothetical protein